MVLTLALQRDTDTAYVDQVLRHELTHMVTDNLPAVPPTWLVEGAAEYTASRVSPHGRVDGVSSLQQRGLTQAQWRGLRNGTFRLVLRTQPDSFYAGTNGQVSDAYTSAWFTCLYIADHYGEATLRRLYDRAAEDAITDSLAAAETDSLAEVLHTTRAKLIRSASSYARGLRRHFV